MISPFQSNIVFMKVNTIGCDDKASPAMRGRPAAALEPAALPHRPTLATCSRSTGREGAHAGTNVPITLQGTAGGFSAEFMDKLPQVEQAMTAHGLDPGDFIISKDNAASANMRPLGPFFYDYTVFVGRENFTVTEPNDMRFLEYFMDRILAPDEEPAPRKRPSLFGRFFRWMARPI
jgi:hypothetical protein